MTHPLFNSLLRVARAREHYDQLIELVLPHVAECMDRSIAGVVLDDDLRPVAKPTEKSPGPPIPLFASILAGELVQSLRIALDYLIFSLAEIDSGEEQDGTQFPIETTPAGFDSNQKRFLKGLSAEHIAAVRALQPFSGVDWARQLRDLSNPDKHRKLFTQGVQVTTSISREHGAPGSFADRYSRYGRLYITADGGPEEHVFVDFHPTGEIMYENANGLFINLISRLDILIAEVTAAIEAFSESLPATATNDS